MPTSSDHRRLPDVAAAVDEDHEDHDNSSLTLRELAARASRPLRVGAAILPAPLFDETDSRYRDVLTEHFNAVVVEHHLKWSPLCEDLPGPHHDGTTCATPGRYDFSHVDRLVDFAVARGLAVKGHVLVWHVTSPGWLEKLSASELRREVRRHIFTVVGRYKDVVREWDVVNEALAPDGSLADNVFLRTLGPSYVEECFRWAHEADPTAALLYNDNKVEGAGTPKSDAFYELLRDLVARGVPVHGAGLQAHLDAAGTGRGRAPSPQRVRAQIRRLGALGLRVNVSEMDVRASRLPDAPLRGTARTEIYRDFLRAALAEPALDGIWFWGFTDRHTWVTDFYYEDEPLLFDEEYRKKNTYRAVAEALASVDANAVRADDDDHDDDDAWLRRPWMRPEPERDSRGDAEGDARPDWLLSPEKEQKEE